MRRSVTYQLKYRLCKEAGDHPGKGIRFITSWEPLREARSDKQALDLAKVRFQEIKATYPGRTYELLGVDKAVTTRRLLQVLD